MSRPRAAILVLGASALVLALSLRTEAQTDKPETLISKATHLDLETILSLGGLLALGIGAVWRLGGRVSKLEDANKERAKADETRAKREQEYVTRRECELQHKAARDAADAVHETLVEIKGSIADLTKAVIEGRR